MSGEWKPGDVAITQFGRSVVDSGRRCDNHGSKPHWHHVTNGGWDPLDAHPGASPLIVIDPEDREQGDELRDLIHKHGGVMLLGSVLQAALREFANPTEPRCPAALIVKGEHFPCDSAGGHGMPHGNSAAEAIWGAES